MVTGINLFRDVGDVEDELPVMVSAQLVQIETCCKCFQGLIECSKEAAFNTKVVLLATIKGARSFLDSFIKSWSV